MGNISREFILYGDLVWFDIEESYYSALTYKVGVFLRAIDKHVKQYSYAFKTDDDSYVVMEKLRESLHGNQPDYWGNCNGEEKWRRPKRNPSHPHYMPTSTYPQELYPVWASGMGYALSSNFISCASRHLESLQFMPMEDIAVGMLAEKCNVTCRLEGWTWREGAEEYGNSSGFSYYINSHHIRTPKEMQDMHWQYHFERKYAIGREPPAQV